MISVWRWREHRSCLVSSMLTMTEISQRRSSSAPVSRTRVSPPASGPNWPSVARTWRRRTRRTGRGFPGFLCRPRTEWPPSGDFQISAPRKIWFTILRFGENERSETFVWLISQDRRNLVLESPTCVIQPSEFTRRCTYRRIDGLVPPCHCYLQLSPLNLPLQ